MNVSDQFLRKRCNDVLGQSIRERLSACGGDFIGKRFSHFGEHSDNTLLVDPAGVSEIPPIGESHSGDVVMLSNFHRHALRDQFRVWKLTGEIIERREANLIARADQK